jgi:hypothetical protein
MNGYPISQRVIILLPLGILALTGAAVSTRVLQAVRHPEQMVARELSRALKREVALRRLDVMTPGVIRVQGLRIASGRANLPLLEVPEAEVLYDWRPLLSGRTRPAGVIQAVHVRRPRLLIERYRGNRFNLQELFRPSRKPPADTGFRGTAKIDGARVVFVDYAALAPTRPAVHKALISAVVDGSCPPLIAIDARGNGDGARVGNASCTGTFEPASGAIVLRVTTTTGDAGYWSRYFADLPGMRVQRGGGKVDIDLWKPYKFAPLNADVRISVANADVATRFTRVPLTRVRGDIALSTAQSLAAHMRLAGAVAGTPVDGEGSVLTGDGPVRLAIRARASTVTLPAVRRAFGRSIAPEPIGPTSPVAVSGTVYGPAGSLVVSGTAGTASARLFDTAVRNVRADVTYRDGELAFPSFSAVAGGSIVTGRGALAPTGGGLRLEADIPPVSLTDLRLPVSDVSGTASARVRVAGTLSDPTAEILAYLPRVRARGVVVERVSGALRIARNRYTLSDLLGTVAGGVVRAEGEISPAGALDVTFTGASVPLQSLASLHGVEDVSGILYSDGSLSGSIRDPRANARFQVFGLTAGGQSVDFAGGSVAYAGRLLTVNDTRVASYPSDGLLSGTVRLPAKVAPALNLKATLKQGLLETLLADRGIRNGGVVGSVTGEATITGTTGSPVVAGSAAVRDAYAGPLPVETAGGAFEYRNGLLKLSNLTAASGGATVSVPELRLRKGVLEGRFSATGIRPSQFPQPWLPYVGLDGVFQVTGGEVYGPVKDPVFRGTLESSGDPVAVNGVPLDSVVARGRWNGDELTLGSVSIGAGGTEVIEASDVTVRMPRDSRPFGLDGLIRIHELPAATILNLAKRSPWLQEPRQSALRQRLNAIALDSLAGGLSATVRLKGTLEDLEARGNVVVGGPNGFRYGALTVDRASVDGSVRNARLDGKQPFDARVDIPDGGIEVSYKNSAENIDMVAYGGFTGQVRGEISHAKIDAYNVPLAMLRPLLADATASGLEGVIGSLTVEATGRVLQPDLSASLSAELKRGSQDGGRIALDTQNINVREGRAEVNGIRLTAGPRYLDFSGYVPFHYPWLAASPAADRSFQVQATMAEQSLDVLELLPATTASSLRDTLRKASGSLSGSVTANGLLAGTDSGGTGVRDLKVRGAVNLSDGQFQVAALENGFKDVKAELAFEGDRVRLPRLEATSTAGGKVEADPSSAIRFEQGKLTNLLADVGLVFKGFRLEERPGALGYGERIRGNVDGRLDVSGSPMEPLVAGELTLSKVEVSPPTKQGPPDRPALQLAVRPKFQLTVVGGSDVWLRSSALRMRLDDRKPVEFRRLRIGGQYPYVTVLGTLTSREGAINYPTARFRLTDAEATVNYVAAETPAAETTPSYSFRASAQSRLYATLNGRREPVTVYITARGPVERRLETVTPAEEAFPYKLEIRSVPSLPERQLVSLITREQALLALTQGTSTPEQVLMQETVNVLQTSVLPAALSGFEASLSEALGLESLTLEYVDRRRGVNVSLAKLLSDRIRVELTVPVGEGQAASSQAWMGRLSYTLTPSLRLSLIRQRGPYLLGVVSASYVNSITGNSETVDETALLLEGTIGF